MVTYNENGRGTKGSHFVWRKYLEPFSNSKKMTFGYNLHESKIVSIPIVNAGKKNDIYRLRQRISGDDIQLFKAMFGDCSLFPEDGDKVLMELVGFLNNDPSPFLRIESVVRDAFLRHIDSELDEVMLSRNQEELFTYYESNFFEIYKLLLTENSAFFNDLYVYKDNMILGYNAGRSLKLSNFLLSKFGELMFEIAKCSLSESQIINFRKRMSSSRSDMEKYMRENFAFCNDCFLSINYFLTFLLTQMFRTKKMKDRILSVKGKMMSTHEGGGFEKFIERFNSESFYSLFIHGAAFKVGASLIQDEYRVVFVNNTGDKNFVTSDQPVINTYISDNMERLLNHDELELYYPLTPKLAMLLTKKAEYLNIESIEANSNDVLQYNKMLSGNAWHFVYGQNKEDVIEAVEA